MNKASEKYNTKVEIPISVILETIFSDDNHDVETLCRWAKHYGFVDLEKENEKDKLGYYKLQDDYTKQSFYVWLDKEERKQYDYEDFLLDKIQQKDKEIERLNNIIDTILDFPFFKEECPLNFGFNEKELETKAQDVFYEDEWCEKNCDDTYKKCWLKYFDKLKELKEGDNR